MKEERRLQEADYGLTSGSDSGNFPSNISEVIWALATRVDPATSIDIVRDAWGAFSDPMKSPEEKRLNQEDVMSRALITAVKPYWWIDKFPASIGVSAHLEKQLREKWQHLFPA